MSDVVVIGAGMVGAACAYYGAMAGLSVTVLEQGFIAGGTTSRGEGNVLVSDKEPGPELDLALWSRDLWLEVGADLGTDTLELEEKGGLVVAEDSSGLDPLHDFADAQATAGVDTRRVPATSLRDHEPHLAEGLAGGVLYPQDMQVQPVLAAASLLEAARSRGAHVSPGTPATGIERDHAGRVSAVLTTNGRIPTPVVVNAAGPWGGLVSDLIGTPVPVLPRRGFVLVTEPLPKVIHHKVYSADYVGNVGSDEAGLETSTVIEGTRGGTLLIGASRERVGFDDTFSVEITRMLARQALRLFPFLERVRLIRAYRGFRPYCPDHLPVIGEDPRTEGVFHACGHEGAGIGLAPATGKLIAQLVTGDSPGLSPSSFAPTRFLQATA
ncbi:MAG: NAD(P)/FAD-dependent oxidoreductase [Actinomycetes bacterium]